MGKERNKMGYMPIKKLIINMSLPMMASMLVQALYNVVDSVFVARLGQDALTAVTTAFPLQNLMIAVGSGTGVGMNALLSRSLGEKRFDRSDAAANNGLFLTLCNVILFFLIGIFAARPFIYSQTTNELTREYGIQYLTIVSCLSIGLFFQMTFERLLQSTGRTFYSMISQMVGAVINIIFDPILIFGLGFFPKMGVAGAAFATVLGQTVASVIGMILNLKKNSDITFSLRQMFTIRGDIVREIYQVGVPSILMMSIGSVMTYMMNLILKGFSETAIAVFGAYFKLQSFFFMPVFGLNNGLIPVLAYNYGAKSKKRIKEAIRFAMTLAICIMIVGFLAFQILPARLLGMFDASEEMVKIGVPALRIISLTFPVAGGCIAIGSVFQAFSKGTYSLAVSVGRQLVILIPAAWILAQFGNVDLVWAAFPIAEVASLLISVFYFRKILKEKINPLQEESSIDAMA